MLADRLPVLPQREACLQGNTANKNEWVRRFGELSLEDVGGGGDCQFRVIAAHVYRNPEMFKTVRKEVAEYMLENGTEFKDAYQDSQSRKRVPRKDGKGFDSVTTFNNLGEYCKAIEEKEWGTSATLLAAARRYNKWFRVLSSANGGCMFEDIFKGYDAEEGSDVEEGSVPLYIGHYDEFHFVLVRNRDGESGAPKRKKESENSVTDVNSKKRKVDAGSGGKNAKDADESGESASELPKEVYNYEKEGVIVQVSVAVTSWWKPDYFSELTRVPNNSYFLQNAASGLLECLYLPGFRSKVEVKVPVGGSETKMIVVCCCDCCCEVRDKKVQFVCFLQNSTPAKSMWSDTTSGALEKFVNQNDGAKKCDLTNLISGDEFFGFKIGKVFERACQDLGSSDKSEAYLKRAKGDLGRGRRFQNDIGESAVSRGTDSEEGDNDELDLDEGSGDLFKTLISACENETTKEIIKKIKRKQGSRGHQVLENLVKRGSTTSSLLETIKEMFTIQSSWHEDPAVRDVAEDDQEDGIEGIDKIVEQIEEMKESDYNPFY